MNRAGRRRWLWLGAAAVLAVLLVLAFRARPLVVEVAPVARGPLQVTVEDEGETRVLDRYVVASPVAGRLERINLRAGDHVQQGQVVARVQPAPLDPRQKQTLQARVQAAEAAQKEAEAAVARTRAAYEQAERNLRRAAQLAEAQVISREEREQAELNADSARRVWEAARFRQRVTAYQLAEARAGLLAAENETAGRGRVLDLRAPVSGRVFRLREESERVVAAGTPLLELGDPAAIEVVTDILSSEAVKVHAGAPVWIEGWGGEQPLEGSVRYVEPSAFTKISALGVEEQRVNVVINLPHPPETLGDRFRVEVRIVVWQAANVLRIPASALFRHGNGWGVFLVEGGRARLRDVRIGHRNSEWAEVTAGLRTGENVVAYPSADIRDGVRVEMAKEWSVRGRLGGMPGWTTVEALAFRPATKGGRSTTALAPAAASGRRGSDVGHFSALIHPISRVTLHWCCDRLEMAGLSGWRCAFPPPSALCPPLSHHHHHTGNHLPVAVLAPPVCSHSATAQLSPKPNCGMMQGSPAPTTFIAGE